MQDSLGNSQNSFPENPPNSFFLSRSRKKAYEHLVEAINQRDRFFVLIGEEGAGKTRFLEHFARKFYGKPGFKTVVISGAPLSFDELLSRVCNQLGLEQENNANKVENLFEISNRLEIRLLLLIDDANKLPPATLRALAQAADDTLFLVFTGRPELLEMLREAGLIGATRSNPLVQWLGPLLLEEISEYLASIGMETSRHGKEYFTEADRKSILRATHGDPANINRFCQFLAGNQRSLATTGERRPEIHDALPTARDEKPDATVRSSWTPTREQLDKAVFPAEEDSRTRPWPASLVKPAIFWVAGIVLFVGAGWFVYERLAPSSSNAGLTLIQERKIETLPAPIYVERLEQLLVKESGQPIAPADVPAVDAAIPAQEIEQLFALAEDQISQGHLTHPEEGNALATYREILVLNPGQSDALASIEHIKQALRDRAQTLLAEAEWEQARQRLDEVLTIDPEDDAAQAALAQLNEAEKANIEIRDSLGVAAEQLRSGRLTAPPGDNALRTFREILREYPNQAEAHAGVEQIKNNIFELATVAQAEKAWDSARTQLRQLLEIEPGDEKAQAALAWIDEAETEQGEIALLLRKAKLLREKKDAEELSGALALYRDILRRDSSNRQALDGIEELRQQYLSVAADALSQRKWATAQQLLAVAVEIDPNDESAQASLSEAMLLGEIPELLSKAEQHLSAGHINQPEVENAFATYQEVMRRNPDNPEALAGIEAIKIRLLELAAKAQIGKEWETARNHIAQILSIDAGNKRAHEALAELEKKNAIQKKIEAMDPNQRALEIEGILRSDSNRETQPAATTEEKELMHKQLQKILEGSGE